MPREERSRGGSLAETAAPCPHYGVTSARSTRTSPASPTRPWGSTTPVPDEPGVVASQMLVMVPPTCRSADHMTGTTDAGRTVTSAQKPLPQSDAIAPVTRRFTGAGAGAGTGAGPGFGAVPSRPITTSLHE